MTAEKMALAKAINESLRTALDADPKVLIMGEDVGKLGGVFRVTDGLQKDFGEERVIDTPLAESGIVGTAIGLALRGYRPVVEIQFDGFVFPAYDQIVTQLAKMHARALGKIKLPVVIRIPYGGGIGAVEHHSESPEALFAHVAGLKVVSPSNASDAYWMMQQAIQSDDPVIFFEPKRRYWDKSEVNREAIPGPLHKARVVREGSDLTLAAYGPMVKVCQEVASAAQEEGKSSKWWTCGPCPPSTSTPSRPRSRRPAAWSWSTRHRCSLGRARRSRPGSRSGASTTWRHPC